jgi:DNA-binding MarR family transcriptional regulator
MFFFFLGDQEWEHSNWKAFSVVLSLMNRKFPNMSIGAFRTFIELASKQTHVFKRYANLKELSEIIGIPYAVFTRHIDSLSVGLPGSEGANLIQKVPVGDNQKSKTVELTQDGANLLKEIATFLDQTRDYRQRHWLDDLPRPAPPASKRPGRKRIRRRVPA